MLTVTVAGRLGAFDLDVTFAGTGVLTALFGPSGSGKSSLVHMIAGLRRPERGRIEVGGRVLFDSETGIDVPVHRRRIGCVFQECRLFPHLTVRQNLLYGRRFLPLVERWHQTAPKLEPVIEMLGITALLARRPGDLSGGEKQRVAIGRALLAAPRLLLMDEPLAALDHARKQEILPYIERLRDEARLPIVYVSHALDEVTRLADTLVLLTDGRIVASGPVTEVSNRLDLNGAIGREEAGSVLETTVLGHDDRFDLTVLAVADHELRVPRIARAPGTRTRITVRARDVAVAITRPQNISVLNILEARIRAIGPGEGPYVELLLDLGGHGLRARLTRQSLTALALAPGQSVFALIKSVSFEREQGGSAPRDK